MISWRGLLLIALFLCSARNEAREQQRKRKRLREKARRRRVAAFIKQQGRCKQALIILVAACSLSQPRAKRSVWMLPTTSHDYGTCNIRSVPQLFQSHSVYRLGTTNNLTCVCKRSIRARPVIVLTRDEIIPPLKPKAGPV